MRKPRIGEKSKSTGLEKYFSEFFKKKNLGLEFLSLL